MNEHFRRVGQRHSGKRPESALWNARARLQEANGDLEAAVTILRKKGLSSLAKKSGRDTKDGLIGTYIHNGKIGVMVEVNCESDFVARNPDFQVLVKDIAMQIAASDPRFMRREDVTEDVLAKEREIYTEQARSTGKPETGARTRSSKDACRSFSGKPASWNSLS